MTHRDLNDILSSINSREIVSLPFKRPLMVFSSQCVCVCDSVRAGTQFKFPVNGREERCTHTLTADVSIVVPKPKWRSTDSAMCCWLASKRQRLLGA